MPQMPKRFEQADEADIPVGFAWASRLTCMQMSGYNVSGLLKLNYASLMRIRNWQKP